MNPQRCRLGTFRAVAGTALAAFLVAGSAQGAALVVGGTSTAAVEINLGALDALGPAPDGPGSPRVLIMPVPSAVVLIPPALDGGLTRVDSAPILPVATAPLVPPLPTPAPTVAAAVPEPAPLPPPEPAPPPIPEQVAAVEPEPAPEPAQPLDAAEPAVEQSEQAEPLAPPEPLPVVEPEPSEPEVASLDPSGPVDLTAPGPVLTVGFAADEMDLRPEATGTLDALVAAMTRDETARIQLMAYAGSQGGSASAARRLSLSRALAVRGYLIENGVRSTRIDVRALGDAAEDGAPDRVDVVALPR